MNAEARGLRLRPQFRSQDAAALVRRRLPGARIDTVDATHHEYLGVIHRVDYGAGRAARSNHLVHSLVDRAAGSALIAPEFARHTEPIARPQGVITGAGSLAIDAAERVSRRVVETSVMRRSRLGLAFELALVEVVDPVWKPNWLVTAQWRGRRVRVLVDGLNGEHWSDSQSCS